MRDGCDDHDDDGIGGRRDKSGKSLEEKKSMASKEPELNGIIRIGGVLRMSRPRFSIQSINSL